jgi:hypothetical protein
VSEAPESPQPAEAAAEPTQTARRRIGLTRLVLVLCGLILAITGLIKFGQGMVQMFGGANEEIQQLLKESDAALLKAQQKLQAAAPALRTLETAINSEPLADVRANHAEEFKAAADGFRLAAKLFHEAAAKLDAVKEYNLTESGLLYVKTKTEWCNFWARVCSLHAKMIDAVLDESIVDQQQLVATVSELVAERSEIEQGLQQLNAELEKLAPADQKQN